MASYDQTHNESIIQGLDHRSYILVTVEDSDDSLLQKSLIHPALGHVSYVQSARAFPTEHIVGHNSTQLGTRKHLEGDRNGLLQSIDLG